MQLFRAPCQAHSPYGSGITTTQLKMLRGLCVEQIYRLFILGEEWLHAKPMALPRLKRQAGFIFQAHNPLPYLTALENVRIGLEVYGHSLEQGRAAMDRCAPTTLEEMEL